MQLINNEKLSEAKLIKEFSISACRKYFSDEVDSELVINDFPSITDGGSFHVDSIPSGESIIN